jgi:hypothetical protein
MVPTPLVVYSNKCNHTPILHSTIKVNYVTYYSPHIPHGLAWDEIQVFEVSGFEVFMVVNMATCILAAVLFFKF